MSCLTQLKQCRLLLISSVALLTAYWLDCQCRRGQVEMHKQALRARQGSACSSSGRDGSAKMSLSSSLSSHGRTRQQVTARANASSNSVPVLAQAPTRSSSKAFSSRVSRKNTCLVRSVLADAPTQAVGEFTRGGHWQVHKFGGTCMASAARLKAAAELVSPCCWNPRQDWQHWSNCCQAQATAAAAVVNGNLRPHVLSLHLLWKL